MENVDRRTWYHVLETCSLFLEAVFSRQKEPRVWPLVYPVIADITLRFEMKQGAV